MRNRIPLGSTVRDTVSGFTGTVLSRSEALYEAPQVRVHPNHLTSDGNISGSVWLEEGRVEVIDHPAKMIRTEGQSSNESAEMEGLLPWLSWLALLPFQCCLGWETSDADHEHSRQDTQ